MRERVYCWLTLSSLLLLTSCEFTPAPSKLERIEQGFFDKKESYVALYDMLIEDDKLVHLDVGFSRVVINDYYEFEGQWNDQHHKDVSLYEVLETVGISQQRYDQYKELMARVCVGAIRKDDGHISFIKDSFGILDGWFLEIECMPEEELSEYVSVMEGTIVSDVYEIPLEKEGEYYLPLEGNWYLHYSMEY